MSYFRLQPHISDSSVRYDVWLVGSTPIRSGLFIDATNPPMDLPRDLLVAKLQYNRESCFFRPDLGLAPFADNLFSISPQQHRIPFADQIQGLIALHLATVFPEQSIREIPFSLERESQFTRLYIEQKEQRLPDYAKTVVNAIKLRSGLKEFPLPENYRELFAPLC